MARGGVRVRVRVTPRAADSRIGGIHRDGDGAALKVSVTAPPADGRANAAVIKLLAKAWRLPPSSLSVAAGTAGRHKTLAVAGDGPALLARLEDWAAGHATGGTVQ